MTAVLQSSSHLPSSPSSHFSCTPNDGSMQSRTLLSEDDRPTTLAEARGAKDQVEGSSASPAAANSAVRRTARRAQRHTEEEEEEQEEQEEEESQQLSLFALFLTIFRRSLLGCRTEREKDDHHQLRSSMEIGWPTQVRHVAHVTFDRFEGFLGLPDEFEPEVTRRAPSASTTVFGVSTESMQCSYDSRGNSVPTILLMMQKRLYTQGGLQVEGIFRITADNTQEELVRDQLNSGVVPDGIEVHCLAGLIKAWFRELPNGVLDSLTAEQVMECQSEEDYVQLVRLLPHAESALLDWAVNLMADVVQEEPHNKMNAHNVATVFAPNMTQMADPLTALMHAVQVMNLLKTLILKALREREQEVPDGSCASQSKPSDKNDKQTPPKAYKDKAATEQVHQEASVAEKPSDLLKEDTTNSGGDSRVPAPVVGAKDILGDSPGCSTTDNPPRRVHPTPADDNSAKGEATAEGVSLLNATTVHPTPADDNSAKGEATADEVSVPNASAAHATVRKKAGQPSFNANSKRPAPPALKKPSIRASALPAAASTASEKSRGISTLSRINSKVERVEAWR